MKKLTKIVLWFIGITAILAIIIMGIGYKIHNQVETFVETEGGLTNANVVTSSDKVLCKSGSTGLVVSASVDGKTKYFPVCGAIFGEASIGAWNEK